MFASERSLDASSFAHRQGLRRPRPQRAQHPRPRPQQSSGTLSTQRRSTRHERMENDREIQLPSEYSASASVSASPAHCLLCDSELRTTTARHRCRQCPTVYFCLACAINAPQIHPGHRLVQLDTEQVDRQLTDGLEGRQAVANTQQPHEPTAVHLPEEPSSPTNRLGDQIYRQYKCDWCDEVLLDRRYECQECLDLNLCMKHQSNHFMAHTIKAVMIRPAEEPSSGVAANIRKAEPHDIPQQEEGEEGAFGVPRAPEASKADEVEFLREVDLAADVNSSREVTLLNDMGGSNSLDMEDLDDTDTDDEDIEDDTEGTGMDDSADFDDHSTHQSPKTVYLRDFVESVSQSVVSAVSRAMKVTMDREVLQHVNRAVDDAACTAFFDGGKPTKQLVYIQDFRRPCQQPKRKTLLDFDLAPSDGPVQSRRRSSGPRKLWHPKDQRLLRKLKAKGWTMTRIAQALNRTASAVEQQWRKQSTSVK